MLRRLPALVCVVTLIATLSAQEAAPLRPRTIRTARMTSEALGTVRTFGLLLPPDYDRTTRRYPVLYLLHGSGQQHATWGRRTLLDGATGMIVVMPDMDRTRYARANGVPEEAAETFITSELVDHIDTQFRTLARRESRAIAGLSIGGFGAMYLGLRHPDRFGAIGAFSAPYDMGGTSAGWLPIDLAVPTPSIYLGCGVADPLLASNRRFDAWLQAQHVPHRYEEGPGAHTWDAWDWQLRAFLMMLPWPG